MWVSKWFYKADVPLHDLAQPGIPPFSLDPLKKLHSRRPQSISQKDDTDMARLVAKVRCLTNTCLIIIDVMATTIDQRVQPLQ